MRLPTILLSLSLLHTYLASAKALLSVFESYVVEGSSYNVSWLSDTNYVSDRCCALPWQQAKYLPQYLDLLVVHQTNSYGWVGVQTLFQNRTSRVPDDSYQWIVGTNLTAEW